MWARELRVALAAELTLQEWRLHIDAMDKLVAGKITLAQATALWDASEKSDLIRIDRFRRLDASLRSAPSRCRPAATETAGACATAAQAVKTTIAAARTAVRTWKLHIRQMEMLRAGEISVDQAMQMWHRLWRKGKVQTVRYDHRAANALAHHCT